MYFEIAVAAIMVGTYVYYRWVVDHPSPKPVDIGTPRTDEGAPVPMIYGTCRVRAPILAWSGIQRSLPHHSRFAYFLDMVYVVGIPFLGGGAELLLIYSGDVPIFLQAGSTYPYGDSFGNNFVNSLPIWFRRGVAADRRNYWVENTPSMVFGDTSSVFVSGGPFNGHLQGDAIFLTGFVEFHTGTPTQQISDQLSGLGTGIDDLDIDSLTDTQGVMEGRPMNGLYRYENDDHNENIVAPPQGQIVLPSNQPSYRNQVLCCLYQWCNGDRTQIPAYNFVVRSLSTGTSAYLGQSLADDADPAAVLLDLLTSSWGKLALPIAKIDLPSFQAASLTLFNEGHGYSRSIEAIGDASEIIGDVMRQIDGVYYEEPTTGKIVLKLVRNDYNPLTLIDVNPSNARPAEGSWISVQGQAETLNQVRVTFTDRENAYADGLAIGQDFANVVAQGGKLRSVDLRFPGCCTRVLAQKIASRELAAVTRPIVKASAIGNRTFYLTRPGDVVTFSWPQLGIDRMVMRVARVNLGTLHDGSIHLDLIRDIFDVSNGAFPVAA
jgi:hypothetical protein